MEKVSLQALLPQTRSIPSGWCVPACILMGTPAPPWTHTPPADTPLMCRKQHPHSCICTPIVQASSGCQAKGLNTYQTTQPSQGRAPVSAPLVQSPPRIREKVLNTNPKLGYRPSQQQRQ